jgi:hypothetical protein
VHRQQAAALSPAALHREADRLERLAARTPGPRLEREPGEAGMGYEPDETNESRPAQENCVGAWACETATARRIRSCPYVVRRRVVHERLVADALQRVGREEARWA